MQHQRSRWPSRSLAGGDPCPAHYQCSIKYRSPKSAANFRPYATASTVGPQPYAADKR
jgi:hypothetical protein